MSQNHIPQRFVTILIEHFTLFENDLDSILPTDRSHLPPYTLLIALQLSPHILRFDGDFFGVSLQIEADVADLCVL